MRRLLIVLALLPLLAPSMARGATRYVAPTGSGTACTQLQPCSSFAGAYRAAAAGDSVEVAAGTYPGQSLSSLPARSVPVTIGAALPGTVRIGYLSINGTSNVEVRDVQAAGWGVTNRSAHVVLRNIKVDGVTQGGYIAGGVQDLQILGGEIAHVDPNDGIHMNNNGGGSNTDIVIDGLYMHDLSLSRDPASHDDCIQAGDATNLTIRNSRFENCGTQGVFTNPYNGGTVRNVLIEHNTFGVAQLGYNILYVGDTVGVTVADNTFRGGVYTYNPASFTHLRFLDNVVSGNDAYNCSVLKARSEVYTGNTCGTVTQPPTTTSTTPTTPTTTSTVPTPPPPPPACGECDALRAQLAQAQAATAAARTDLAAMTASRDSVQAIADAYKARAEKAEGQVARIRAIAVE